jgi:hypothetical protein
MLTFWSAEKRVIVLWTRFMYIGYNYDNKVAQYKYSHLRNPHCAHVT